MTLLSPPIAARRDELSREFVAASPFRHTVIDGFLDPALAQQLLEDFPRFEDRYALNEMGEVGGKAVRMNVRELSEAYRKLDAWLQTPDFLGFVSAVTGIPDLLYDADYIGGGTHENRHGQSLDAHVDFNYHPRSKTHRRLNLIVYLNHEWEGDWGGVLELHSDPWNAANNHTAAVLPLFNRCVIFETTETSWHGFSRIELPPERRALSRKSFAIYLYTRQRPPQETAPPHATIYVPDAMPAQLEPGKILERADVADLQARFSRLRTQLRYLYDREKQFGAQIAGLEYALAEARAAQRIDLQGYAVQQRPEGLWPDGWAAKEVLLRFTPSRRTKRLDLDVWTPAALPDHQRLDITINGRRYEQHLRPGSRTRVELALKAAAGEAQEVRILAQRTWQPSADGGSGDERELAYRLIGAELSH